MTEVIDTKRLGRVLQRATAEKWGNGVPRRIPGSLVIAINSLARTEPRFWEKDAEYLVQLLKHNPGVQKIFARTEDTLLAFAIRQARK